LWFEVCKVLCEQNNITEINDFFFNTLINKIPTVHTIAATASVLRKKYPQFKPTEEQKKRKLEIKQQWIERYRST
jgi:hypothetical protein